MGAARDSPHLHLSPLTASLLNCTTSLLSCVACDAFPAAGTAGKAALAPSLAEVGMRRPWQHPHTCLLSPAHATTSAARGANRTRNTECSSLQQVWGCLSTAMGHRVYGTVVTTSCGLTPRANHLFTHWGRCPMAHSPPAQPAQHSLVPGRMSDISMSGPVFWIRAG